MARDDIAEKIRAARARNRSPRSDCAWCFGHGWFMCLPGMAVQCYCEEAAFRAGRDAAGVAHPPGATDGT